MGINLSLYSRKNLTFIRIVSTLAVLILIISTARILIQGNEFNTYGSIITKDLGTILLNCSSIICFVILVIYPEKLMALSIISFMYSLVIFIDEPNNQMGILMSLLCYYTLYIRDFFHKMKFLKTISLILIFLISFLSQIRFGFSIFLNSFFDSLAFLLVACIILFFFKELIIIETKKKSTVKILNLFPYIGTRKEDVQLLKLVLEKKQYLEISQIVFRTEGTVRNRLNKLYDILGVADRIGFVTTYVGYEIVYDNTIADGNNKLSSIKKKKKKKKKKVNLNTKT